MRGINKSHWVGGLLLAGVLLTGTGRAQLADGPWPMFRHDQRHTGQSPYVGPSEVNLAWTFVGEDEGLGEPVIGPTGTIYVGARNGRIGGRDKRKFYALHPDGSIKWTFSCESSEEKFRSAPAIGIDGTIYFASTLYFYAVNDSGFLKWKHELPSDSSPVIGGDGTLYVPDARRLYAFDLNGNVKWTYDTGGTSTMTSPAIGPDGSIYVVARGLLYSISPQGKLNWIYEFFPAVPGQWVNNGPTIGTDGTIYVTSYDNGYIIAVNPDSTEKWHLNLKGSTGGSWPAIGSDGTIYVSTRKPYTLSPDTTRFCALNPDGSIKWKIDDIHLISPAIGSDGTIYGGSWEGGSGKFYAVTSDGNLKWTYDITGPRSPAIDKDGTLYLSSGRGRLYAFFRKNPETSPDPSVAPGSMTFDPQTSTPNNQVRITATIEELTDTQAATCDIIFYYDDKTNPIDTVATYLPPGWKRNVEVVWNTQGLEVRDYTIIAEISNASPAESNLSNNEGEAVYTFVPLIQPRIDAAQEGDTVWVDPGVYFENLTLKNGLVLKSRSGPEVTIINAQKRDVTIKAEGWEFDSTTVVEGFTITNGSGGLLLRQSSPIMSKSIIFPITGSR